MKKILLIGLFILFGSARVQCQWKMVAPNIMNSIKIGINGSSDGSLGTMTFSDGVIWVGHQYIYSSSDTGKTWIRNILESPFARWRASAMNFFDKTTGVICFEAWKSFTTQDGGQSWSEIPLLLSGYPKQIQYLGNPLNLMTSQIDTGFLEYQNLPKSTDGGSLWNATFNPINNYADIGWCFTKYKQGWPIFAFLFADPTIPLRIDSIAVYTSHNEGLSWQKVCSITDYGHYSIEIDPCDSNTIYFPNEGLRQNLLNNHSVYDSTSDMYVSNDGAKTFTIRASHSQPYLNGSVAVSDNAVFCPTTSGDGVLRSTDKGLTWQSIGGPPSPVLCRFICAVNSDIVFVVDTNGSVWMTSNSGGVPYTKRNQPKIHIDTFRVITTCDTTETKCAIATQPCGHFSLKSITLEGNDSAFFSLNITDIPDSIQPESNLLFPIGFNPQHGEPGTYKTKVHIIGTFGSSEQTYPFDSSIQISVTVKPIAPKIASSNSYIRFDTVSTCGYPIDTVMTLTNHGCDTLRITSGPGNLPPEFQLLPPFSLPIVLAPDSSVTVRFRFAPTKKGNYVASASFIAEQQGLQQKVSLSLEGNGIEEGGLLSYEPKQFSFPSLSICSHDSSSGFVTNIGCSEMTIAASYFGDLDFTNTTIGTSTGTSVKPKDTLTYKVYLNPSQKGKRQGYILLYSKDAHNSAIDSIPFSVTVLDGTRILSASNSTLDFGSTSLCSEKDTTITLQNTGCDTLWVTATTLQGTGFIVEDATPFFILKGESKTITVHTTIDSTNHQSTNNAQISFTTNADNSISPIGLIRRISYPSSYPVRFSVSTPTGANQSQLSMNILADSLPAGLTRLDATLSIGNKDLLSFIDYQSKNQVSINGDQITITGNPITTDNGNLAELHYKVYLTKDSTSDISFKNIVFNNADADYANCIATVQGGADNSFDYEFICGERTISSFLKNGELRINSISPNPTRGEITLTLDSPTKQGATIEIYDILGKQVYCSSRVIVKGSNTLSIDTKDLSRGRYSIRINQSASSAFVKE